MVMRCDFSQVRTEFLNIIIITIIKYYLVSKG
jgi:hypothetical protein